MPQLTLYNTNELETMRRVPDKSVDLIICSFADPKVVTPFFEEARRVRRSDACPVVLLVNDARMMLHAALANKEEFQKTESNGEVYVFRKSLDTCVKTLPSFGRSSTSFGRCRDLSGSEVVNVSIPDFPAYFRDPNVTSVHQAISRFCPVGGTVLLPVSGSAEAMMIAFKVGMNVIIAEQITEQYDVIVKAMEEVYARQPGPSPNRPIQKTQPHEGQTLKL